MKSITEFWTHTLAKGLKAKEALVAAGKTAEEIAAGLGETFKYEGDKLKHFVNALEVAVANPEKLSRVLVVQYAEGEKAPAGAVQVEETHYVPDFQKEAGAIKMTKNDPKGGGGKKGGGDSKGKIKTSPWGLTPEEKAAKNKGGAGKAKPTA